MLGKIEGRGERDDRRRDGWMASQLNRHKFVQDPGDGEGQGSLACYPVHGVTKGQIRLSDWTTTNRSRGKSDVTVVAKLEQWSVRHDVVYIVQTVGKAGND